MPEVRPRFTCGRYTPGHDVHWIQWSLSRRDALNRPSRGRFLGASHDGTLTIEVDGEVILLWNHDPDRLLDVISVNGPDISYQPRWGLLRSPHAYGYVFCVAPAEVDRRTPTAVTDDLDGDDCNPYPGPDTSENERVAWAMADLGVTWDRQREAPDWIDPDGGPDEEDPDLYPDPTADDPPFGDQDLDDDQDGA
jgi:hypothetical protein